MRIRATLLFSLLLLFSCNQPYAVEKPAAVSLDGNALKAHIQKLAADDMWRN